MTISAAELALYKALHVEYHGAAEDYHGMCAGCWEEWPCDVVRLIEALGASQELHVDDTRELQAESKRLRAQLATAREAHYPVGESGTDWCANCSHAWPCQTWRALEGTP